MLTIAIALLLAIDAAPTSAVECVNVRLHDGDTAHCDINLGWGVTLRNRSIRAFGYDAPEINRVRQTVEVTEDEIARGRAAKAALEQLIADGGLWAEDSGETDPYGRISARLWVRKGTEWIDVARWMRARKHTR